MPRATRGPADPRGTPPLSRRDAPSADARACAHAAPGWPSRPAAAQPVGVGSRGVPWGVRTETAVALVAPLVAPLAAPLAAPLVAPPLVASPLAEERDEVEARHPGSLAIRGGHANTHPAAADMIGPGESSVRAGSSLEGQQHRPRGRSVRGESGVRAGSSSQSVHPFEERLESARAPRDASCGSASGSASSHSSMICVLMLSITSRWAPRSCEPPAVGGRLVGGGRIMVHAGRRSPGRSAVG